LDDEQCSASEEVTEDPGLVEAMEAMELGEDRWNEGGWSEHAVQVLEDHGRRSDALTLRDDAEEYGSRLSPFLVRKRQRSVPEESDKEGTPESSVKRIRCVDY
jgi:hypothetical protein